MNWTGRITRRAKDSALALLLSPLDLLAMSTYYADEKAHDIAVRKVFGGTVDTEARRTIRDYMVLVVFYDLPRKRREYVIKFGGARVGREQNKSPHQV